MKLKSMTIENFKGCRGAAVNFVDGVTHIDGENGSGKTTIADAWFWVMDDSDYKGHSKPDIRPEGADDGVLTSVELIFTADGKDITFNKTQKQKTSKPDAAGKVKVTTTNTYTVNSVPKSNRDAFAYIEDLGFNKDHFMGLSHPDSFLSGMSDKKQRTKMRDILFSMAENVTDLDVAKKNKKTMPELFGLLSEGYTVEEIRAMQMATKRKIREEYGKDGEILDARIGGLESAKVDIDRDAVEELLQKNDQAVANLDKANKEKTEKAESLRKEIESLKEKAAKAKEEHLFGKMAELNALNTKRAELSSELTEARFQLTDLDGKIASSEREAKDLAGKANSASAEYKTVKAMKFDESKAVCPTCKRRYAASKVATIKAQFEAGNAERMKALAETFNKCKERHTQVVTKLGQLKEQEATVKERIESLNAEISEIAKKVAEAREAINTDGFCTPEIDTEIEAIKKEIEKIRTEVSNNGQVRQKLAENRREFTAQVAKAENNEKIDEKIAVLQAKRIEYEQHKANSEKIIDQIKELEMLKNRQLAESINSHFKLVEWKLFDYQANGEVITDVCEPMIDGHAFSDACNTGRQLLAKIDIIDGLQHFYGETYPVFLDNAEALTSNTTERIEFDGQLILLRAVDGKALEIH